MNIEKKIVRSVTPPSKHVLWLHEKNGNTVIEEFLGNGWTELNITQEKIAEIESNLDSLDKEVVKTINGAAPVSGNINVDTLTPEQMRQVEAAMLLSSQVDRLNALLGLYTDRASLTLSTSATGVQAGKAIVPAVSGSMYGKVEAMSGACVSQEFALTRGDLLLIKPGKTSNDVFTVSQVTTSSDGSKAYTKVMSLNALAEVPTDGYLRFLVMPADMTVCITFFASEAAFSSEVKVMRCGSFESIAETVGNLYAELAEAVSFNYDYLSDMVADAIEQSTDYASLPLLCGQPPILFGAGTPQEAIVPDNWKQYDPQTNTGYQWNGQPSAVGQQYINTLASSGGRYIAVADKNMNLTWKNF